MSKMIKVNLLSPERKEVGGGGPEAAAFPEEERIKQLNKGAIVGASIITLGIIIFLLITQIQAVSAKEQRLAERRARRKVLEAVLIKIEELEKTKDLLERKVQLIQNLKKSQQDAVKMMDALSDAIPEWVWLTNLSFTNKQLVLSGKAFHNNLISDFINNLKGTGYFEAIEFPGSDRATQGGQEVFNFRLNCTFKDKELAQKTKNKEKEKAG